MADILLVYKKNFEGVHDESLQSIKGVLNSQSSTIRVDIRAREQVRRADFIGRDLVIVLGGDGTLTSISHNIDSNTPVMGVNSHPRSDDPNGSLGFYMDSDIDTFANDLKSALEGNAIVNRLPRLQATIETTSGNKIRSDPAMNDLLIANTHQYAPSKYHLRRGEIDIQQHSSGLLFSTWLGQGAWFSQIARKANLGSVEQSDSHYLVIARDLDPEIEDETYMAWTDEATVITSDMHRGYVVPDGWDEYQFNRGATISVDLSGPVLQLLTFRNSMKERFSRD
ncbi:MAG: NAD(+)/NADH kinase [Candidatus Poseidoniaceae archaeon]|nr:NAD(+)/NADH kinase [Candidatus Poseidoniaceae archaeon]